MTEENCNCITMQPHNMPPISVCSNDFGKLIVGTLAVATIIFVAKKLSK